MQPHPIAIPALLSFALFAVHASAQPQQPRLLRNVHPTGSSSMRAITHGIRPGEVLMVLDDGTHGHELWRTDGTTQGTSLVVDWTPGPAGTAFSWLTRNNRDVLFAIDRGATADLGVTDGTAAGTRILVTGLPSRLGPPYLELPSGVLLLTAGGTMWRTDRTPGGTVSLGASEGSVFQVPGWSTFIAGYQGGLWQTDGTPAGTVVVSSGIFRGRLLDGVWMQTVQGAHFLLRAGGVTPMPAATRFIESDDRVLLFDATTLSTWDGTTAPPQVVRQFPSLGDVRGFMRDGRRLLFAADDGVVGSEPWITDGTPAGTQLLADLRPGPASTPLGFGWPIGDRLVFWADTPATGSEPWTTDGTTNGTTLLGDLEPGPGSSVHDDFSALGHLLSGRSIVTTIRTPALGYELWSIDGTSAGTRLLPELRPGPASSFDASGWTAIPAGNTFIYGADDGQNGGEPWALDVLGVVGWLGGACPDAPWLSFGPPVLGTQWSVRAERIAAGSAGFALLSLPPADGVPVAGCRVYLDPNTVMVLAAIVPDAQGRWSGAFPLPPSPALSGLDLVTQSVFAPSAQPMGWTVGTAVWVTLGA